jgi:hypothetical protein
MTVYKPRMVKSDALMSASRRRKPPQFFAKPIARTRPPARYARGPSKPGYRGRKRDPFYYLKGR